eukprot:CAMPEP_0180793336 /NCGR_PEP_ID=MMETSP1038_2-20121128/54935_1 /TAXON_ID=632150 /ORGANISM="Azadinium spinosum, Strain 3D9" /LENGTH=41 /DNA_ID= /DNA_START= /DNA_END= /DNA_ORIENTATION=
MNQGAPLGTIAAQSTPHPLLRPVFGAPRGLRHAMPAQAALE